MLPGGGTVGSHRRLTDRFIKALPPAPEGDRYTEMEIETPGLGVRITDKGHKTFVYGDRFPSKPRYTFREIAPVSAASLAEARETAQEWRRLVRQGIDPAAERARKRAEALRSLAVTFGSVAEIWFAEKLKNERNGADVERDFRNNLMPRLSTRPIAEITDLEVLDIIRAKKQKAPAAARNLLGTLRRFFNWVIDQRCYGLTTSPCDRLRPTKIIGKKKKRQRILTDDELFALWRAVQREAYPFREVYQLLILTALRLNEVADAERIELRLSNQIWTIPADRMKGDDDEARPHAIPLTGDIAAVFMSIPQFNGGPYVFSCTSGKKPVWIGDLVKKRLDRRMILTLRALARRRGEDPWAVDLPHWVNHDIRRTVRSNLSRLKVAEEVREAVLAHARPGIKGTYDLYDYLDEKREALELWAARLRSIVDPPPARSNVVPLTARG
jgi:integrase